MHVRYLQASEYQAALKELTRSLFNPILRPRLRERLPLHILDCVRAATPERHNVIDDVIRQRPFIAPVDGHGLSSINARRALELRVMRPAGGRAHDSQRREEAAAAGRPRFRRSERAVVPAFRSGTSASEFVAWGKPLDEKCPQCGNPYLIEKFLKAGPFAQCPNAECKFKRELPQVEAAPVAV